MKKVIISSFIILILITNIQVYAIWDTEQFNLQSQSTNINEEITPIRNEQGILTGINTLITIPEDYEEQNIIISPSIFSTIGEYKSIAPNDKITVNLIIENKSKYNYTYKDNSFTLSTIDTTKLGIPGNYQDTNAIGFDQLKIYDNKSPYRTFNTAIKTLYNYSNIKDQKEEDLKDEKLSKKLQEKGYKGIEELDKYYLDFYNNKYNLHENSLDTLTYSTIKEIFLGKETQIKETNTKIIELAYNYFYNKLISYTFQEQEITDSTSQNYSIGEYMRQKLGNTYFKDAFNAVNSNSTSNLNNMSLNINGLYTTPIFTHYNLNCYFLFSLIKREEQTIYLEDGLIIPPHTGM